MILRLFHQFISPPTHKGELDPYQLSNHRIDQKPNLITHYTKLELGMIEISPTFLTDDIYVPKCTIYSSYWGRCPSTQRPLRKWWGCGIHDRLSIYWWRSPSAQRPSWAGSVDEYIGSLSVPSRSIFKQSSQPRENSTKEHPFPQSIIKHQPALQYWSSPSQYSSAKCTFHTKPSWPL